MKISGPRAVVHWESNRIPARHHQIQRPGTSGDGAIIKYEVLILSEYSTLCFRRRQGFGRYATYWWHRSTVRQ